jgi:hypothetical protein
MVDIPQQQWQDLSNQIGRLISGINRFGSALGGGSGNSGDRSRAGNQLEREMTGFRRVVATARVGVEQVRKADQKFAFTVMEMADTAQSFSQRFQQILLGFAGGAVAGRLIQAVTSNTQTYQRLNEVGQTFGGSMLDMAKQAGAAGLSLDDFAKLMERSSSAAAALTRMGPQGSLPALALQVRMLTERAGMYGMSLDALNEFTADYAENLRLQGMLEMGTNASRADAVNQFAQDVSTFSAMTGKARREIAEAARTALRDVSVTSRLRATQDAAQRRSLEQATSFLAAIPGEAGTALSAMIGQTFGYGTALFAEGARTFYDAGMGHIVSQFDRLGARIARGENVTDDMFEFAEEFASQVDAQREGLRLQAMAGNQSAIQILRMRDNMDVMLNLTEAQKRQMRIDATTRQRSTAFFSSFNSIFSRLMGALREGFFGQLEGLGQGIAGFLDSANFEGMMENFKSFGHTLGVFVSRVLTPENIMRFGDVVRELVTSAASFISTILTPENLKALGEGFGALFRFSLWAVGGLASLATGLSQLGTAVYDFYTRVARFLGISDTPGEASGSSAAGATAMIATVVTAVVTYMLTKGAIGLLARAVTGSLGTIAGAAGSAAAGAAAPAAVAAARGAGALAGMAGQAATGATAAVAAAPLAAGAAAVGAGALGVMGMNRLGNWRREAVEAGRTPAEMQRRFGQRGRGTGFYAEPARDPDETPPNPIAVPEARSDVPLAVLQRNIERLARQIQDERLAADNTAVGSENATLVELMREHLELTRQAERRRSNDADRQIRATELAAP